jgi:high affinity Mn2+ porin
MNPTAVCVAMASILTGILSEPALAQSDPRTALPRVQDWAIHGQATIVEQGNAGFPSPYVGVNSLPGYPEGRETFDMTLYAGLRPWRGAEIWVNPEVDQGYGLNDTLGVAGFPSGEAYKVGAATPYLRVQRLFLRQTFNLGGKLSKVDPDINQLRQSQTSDRFVVTLGKFAVTDVFDTNTFAHDPKHDFLNWTVIDAGTFDYAADAWGYTVGASGEWYRGDWTLRGGAFDLSSVPNSETLDSDFGQFQLIGEVEHRYRLAGGDGAIKLTGFLSRGRMGTYTDAVALSLETGEPASTAMVRQYRTRTGFSLDFQQRLSGDVGAFLRMGIASPNVEPYEFTDIDRTVSAGFSWTGGRWRRPSDTLAIAAAVNAISSDHQAYFNAGGLGILIGDGQLPRPAMEDILETYYDLAVSQFLHLAFDYQFVNNPAYNTQRGPASIFAARLHAQF